MRRIVFFLIFFVSFFILTGSTWPKYLENRVGAEYEKVRILEYRTNPMLGTDIVELQERLAELGFYQGKINGIFDKEVKKAVQNFQEDNGLAIDGIVKNYMWYRLADTPNFTESVNLDKDSPQGEVSIIIDTFKLRLLVLDDKELFCVFPVAIGRISTPTPIGNFQINHKAVNWGTGFGTRWLGLNVPWGKYGIHGTNKPWSIGRMASHGCIRMYNAHVEKLYPWVKIGTEVTIVGNPLGRLSKGKRRLVNGDRGADVVAIQERLISLGFLQGKADGIYGYQTEKAVKDFQRVNDLPVTGQVAWLDYEKIGL